MKPPFSVSRQIPLGAVNGVAAYRVADILNSRLVEQDIYAQFRKTYFNNPVGFVHDCFIWKDDQGPAFYQDEILESFVRLKRYAVYGPRGIGKTALESWIAIWFALTRDIDHDWKLITTASWWRQLIHYLWPEIRKWVRRLKWSNIGRQPFNTRTEQLQLSLRLQAGEAFAVASDTPDAMEGAHADSLCYLFDEAKVIPADTFDSIEGAFSSSGNEAFQLACSTPGEPSGRFYDICRRAPGYEDWHVRHVTLDETVNAGRVSATWGEQRKLQWGESSAVYRNFVLGEFASSDVDSIIPLAWVEQAILRWRDWDRAGRPGSFKSLGVDVGRFGDKTVFARRFDNAIAELEYFAKSDTMETAGRVVGVLSRFGRKAIIDVIGIGSGVVDRVREQDYEVVAFNASERTDKKDRSGELGFVNKRSAAIWGMREMLDPANGENVALPPDDQLIGDLTAPHYQVVSGGKIKVESKEDIKPRIGRSTDAGDAVVQAFWEDFEEDGPLPLIASGITRGWGG